LNTSEISGDLSSKEKEVSSSEFSGSDFKKEGRDGNSGILGCDNLGCHSVGDMASNSNHKGSRGNKKKSIYVGQWDAIK
jgi:hypothetical protein